MVCSTAIGGAITSNRQRKTKTAGLKMAPPVDYGNGDRKSTTKKSGSLAGTWEPVYGSPLPICLTPIRFDPQYCPVRRELRGADHSGPPDTGQLQSRGVWVWRQVRLGVTGPGDLGEQDGGTQAQGEDQERGIDAQVT